MIKREEELKKIVRELTRWEVELSNRNALNLYDANIFSEHTICRLLNSVYGYNLHNINLVQNNFPAIDLADNFNRVAVQVTTTKATKKIQYTIDSFLANGLYQAYDQLFVLILGKKQKSYPAFDTQQHFTFTSEQNIIDFHGLLNKINSLPTPKVEEIAKILLYENQSGTKAAPKQSSAAKLKKNLALRDKMQKALLKDLGHEPWEHAYYEPWVKFRYDSVIVRSVDDRSYPELRPTPAGQISSWFKMQFWDFYDNGIEFIGMGGKAFFDKSGKWDLLDWGDETRKNNPDYTAITYHPFYRIPYDYIVKLDMVTDPYSGYPSLYVEYAKDGMPYEDILYGRAGVYKTKKPTYLFDRTMRAKLK